MFFAESIEEIVYGRELIIKKNYFRGLSNQLSKQS